MMRWNDFRASVLFAAGAAAAYVPFVWVVAPVCGHRAALVGYSMLLTPIYLAGLGATRRRGLAAAGTAVLGMLAIGLLGPTARESLIALAVVLGIARSGVAYAGQGIRAVFVESLLLVAGLSIPATLLGASTLSNALAIWAFWLVQSAFFLLRASRPLRPARDPFDEARDQAIAILESASPR